jgi:hypothetical protein
VARVKFLLEEQAADLRSFEFAYRFKIQNNGASAIKLLAATPRLAKGSQTRGGLGDSGRESCTPLGKIACSEFVTDSTVVIQSQRIGVTCVAVFGVVSHSEGETLKH